MVARGHTCRNWPFDDLDDVGGLKRMGLTRRGLDAVKAPDGKRKSFGRDRALARFSVRTISAPCTCVGRLQV